MDNEWVDGKVKQRVRLRLGRLDELVASGQLDSLMQSLGRFSEKLAVLGAHGRGESITTRSARIGPALIFQRLWQACSIDQVLTAVLKNRRFEFSVERAIFLTVLHRLFAPGSDRAAEKWKEDYAIEGVDELSLHHLYRAMAWLGEVLPEDQQDGATPFTPRTVKDVIEEELFAQRRDLFSSLDLVFFDTTSIYFEGEGGETIGQRGHSTTSEDAWHTLSGDKATCAASLQGQDHRPDLKQMVVGGYQAGIDHAAAGIEPALVRFGRKLAHGHDHAIADADRTTPPGTRCARAGSCSLACRAWPGWPSAR